MTQGGREEEGTESSTVGRCSDNREAVEAAGGGPSATKRRDCCCCCCCCCLRKQRRRFSVAPDAAFPYDKQGNCLTMRIIAVHERDACTKPSKTHQRQQSAQSQHEWCSTRFVEGQRAGSELRPKGARVYSFGGEGRRGEGIPPSTCGRLTAPKLIGKQGGRYGPLLLTRH